MDYKSEWELLATSLLLDGALGLFLGLENSIVHSLLIVSAVWLTFCALASHACEWFCSLSVQWTKVLGCLSATSAGQRDIASRVVCDFLWYAYLPYRLFELLRDYKNIPNYPCPCGATRRDGSRPALKEHCWKRRTLKHPRKFRR